MTQGEDATRFCGSCGAPRGSTAVRFCQRCGTAFDAAPATKVKDERPGRGRRKPKEEAGAPLALADALADARQRPAWMVAALAFLSSGTYTFFWLWMSWRELKRVRREPSMRPFWHMVATAVPLYGLFRFHEHFRVVDDLSRRAGLAVRAGAGLLTLVYLLLLLVAYTGIARGIVVASSQVVLAPAEPPQGVPGLTEFALLTPFTILAVAAAYAYVTFTGQLALNSYYRSLPDIEVPHRSHAFEWIFLVVFAATFVYQIQPSIRVYGFP